MPRRSTPKHRAIFQTLHDAIRAGRHAPGDRLPSEAELGRTFRTSRITVTRAVRDLQQLGLVSRRAGSGTYVAAPPGPAALSFGILTAATDPTGALERIVRALLDTPDAKHHSLVRGAPGGAGEPADARAFRLCQQYIERKVDGVFFAPLDHEPDADAVNAAVASALDQAAIPIVLLERTIGAYPKRGRHDLVGIDDRRAGHQITEHLLRFGTRRVAFIAAAPSTAATEARESGYREALYRRHVSIERELAIDLDPADPPAVRAFMDEARPGGIVAADDWTAARLMRTLLDLGVRIPADVRLAGIDDADYARVLPVPLTTVRRPSAEIGEAALAVMLDRVAHPRSPVKDVFLQTKLIVRESCGARTQRT